MEPDGHVRRRDELGRSFYECEEWRRARSRVPCRARVPRLPQGGGPDDAVLDHSCGTSVSFLHDRADFPAVLCVCGAGYAAVWRRALRPSQLQRRQQLQRLHAQHETSVSDHSGAVDDVYLARPETPRHPRRLYVLRQLLHLVVICDDEPVRWRPC